MTMPYWAERLRVRLIHELGGYTKEDVDANIDHAINYERTSRKNSFLECCALVSLDGKGFAMLDSCQIERAKDVALADIIKELKKSNAVRYRVVPGVSTPYALQASILIKMPNVKEDK